MEERIIISKWDKLNKEFIEALDISDEWFKNKKNSDTLNEVIKDMIAREQLGIKKYGTTIDRDDYSLKDWLVHAYEESLDKSLYLKKAIQQLQKLK
jgi:cytidylate kinase